MRDLVFISYSHSLPQNSGLNQWQAAPGCNPLRPLDRMKRPEREQVVVDVCRKILDEMGPLPSISRDGRKALKDRVAATVGPDYQSLEAWRTVLARGFQHMRDALRAEGPIQTAQDAPAKATLCDRPGAAPAPAAAAQGATSDAL